MKKIILIAALTIFTAPVFALDDNAKKEILKGLTNLIKDHQQEDIKRREELQRLEKQQLQQTNNNNGTSSYSSSAGSFRWPSRGGMEDWGFQRPSGCQSDDFYVMPLAEKMHKFSNWGSSRDLYVAKRNEYTSGRTGQMIRQAKGNSQAITALQVDLDKIDAELNQLDADGKSYIQLSSTGLENGADVIKAIKRFEIVGQDCGNMQGATNSIACGLQTKAFHITANLERLIQISCHLGLNAPTYQVAKVNVSQSLPPSNSSTSSQASSRNPNKQQHIFNDSDANNQDSQNPIQKVNSYTSQNSAAYDNKYQGRGKKHNSDAEASKCLRWHNGRKQILNDCEYAVEAVFCAINPNNPNSIHAFEMAPYFNCANNAVGMWPIGGKSPLIGKFSSETVAFFACKKPSVPGAKYNQDSKSFSGRCSEY